MTEEFNVSEIEESSITVLEEGVHMVVKGQVTLVSVATAVPSARDWGREAKDSNSHASKQNEESNEA
ncbi:hypothetical protein HMI55_006030 [Coelomomyces lativittatus]|nr:hypothetical protein HMI55_006030 [Coelomomyces lativittatus]